MAEGLGDVAGKRSVEQHHMCMGRVASQSHGACTPIILLNVLCKQSAQCLILEPVCGAAQFDTLPTRVSSAAELEPGDLVFYSGVPFDSTARRHKFDMMHVEMFVGGDSGEATIGEDGL